MANVKVISPETETQSGSQSNTVPERAMPDRDVPHIAEAEVREVVGVFRDYEKFQCALDDLQSNGFGRADLSTVAAKPVVERSLGHSYVKTEEIEDDASVPRAVFISKTSLGDAEGVVIGIGVYVFSILAAGILANIGVSVLWTIVGVVLAGAVGGAIGVLAARLLERRYNDRFIRQMEKGGLVLWVNIRDSEQEALAASILTRYDAEHVHAHTLPVRYYQLDSSVELDLSKIRRPHPTAWWYP